MKFRIIVIQTNIFSQNYDDLRMTILWEKNEGKEKIDVNEHIIFCFLVFIIILFLVLKLFNFSF